MTQHWRAHSHGAALSSGLCWPSSGADCSVVGDAKPAAAEMKSPSSLALLLGNEHKKLYKETFQETLGVNCFNFFLFLIAATL